MFEKKNQPDLVYQSHRVAKESITHFEEVLVQAILGAGACWRPGWGLLGLKIAGR